MRAIAGIIHFDGSRAEPEAVKQLVRKMEVCPTDRQEIRCLGSAGMGHFVKYQLAEDRFEQQPLQSKDGNLLLVTDAMLDNRDYLARSFGWSAEEAAVLPDSAFVLAAYERWGENCPDHLEGRFALAAWHHRERRLFCANDHLGCRPLYFWESRGQLAFATTLRGLLSMPGITREIDETVFACFVAQAPLPEPTRTLYTAIRRLPGGHQMTVINGKRRIVRHWNPDPHKTLKLPSTADYLEAFRSELERAVRTSLQRAQGDVAVMISGGLDSAAVTAIAGKLLAEQGRRLQAIHLLPTTPNRKHGLRELDESYYVRELEKHAPHIDFHYIPNAPEPLPVEAWDDYFDIHQVPSRTLPVKANPALKAFYEEHRIHLVLNGLGGNFLVSPEVLPNGFLTHLLITGKWFRWARETHLFSKHFQKNLTDLIRQTVTVPLKQWAVPSRPASPLHPLKWLDSDLRHRTGIDALLEDAQSRSKELPWSINQHFHMLLTRVLVQQNDVNPSLIGKASNERLTRSPMADVRLNEFCLSIPWIQHFQGGWDRYLMRESMVGLLPESLRFRVTRGFAQPGTEALVKKVNHPSSPISPDSGSAIKSRPYLNAELITTGAIESLPRYEATRLRIIDKFVEWLNSNNNVSLS